MTKSWWEINAVYQIYPRSFKDTNADGIGDLKGITEKLDYVVGTLGVEAIWLSPFYPSPQTDCGYDVSDYFGIDPLFGTMADFDELLTQAHEKGLKVMIDLVPNHTSDQHPWFQESRSSRDNPKRDWYVWRDQPNNWQSLSGGSSWAFDEVTGQHYLHSFLSSQPDLNWENPAVRDAIKDVMRFWLSKGVDGFRVDAVWALSKDPNFADDSTNESYNHPDEYGGYIHAACKNGPRLSEYLRELSGVVAEYSDAYLLFEYYPDPMLGEENEQLAALHGVDPSHAAPFYFGGLHQPWHAERFGRVITEYLSNVPAGSRPIFCFSNHDQPRLISRFGQEQARLIALMQMTLPGLPVMYYGDEIGMENVMIPLELTKDKFEKTGDSGGRDSERTPMQWNDALLGGFSEERPWLPLSADIIQRNVAHEITDPDSWLNLYRKLLEHRHDPVLRAGSFEVVPADSGYVLVYKRSLEGKTYYVVLNFADAMQIISLPEPVSGITVMTHPWGTLIREDGRVTLQGFGAALLIATSD